MRQGEIDESEPVRERPRALTVLNLEHLQPFQHRAGEIRERQNPAVAVGRGCEGTGQEVEEMIGSSCTWPSGDWGDEYVEGMRKLGIEFDDEEYDDNDLEGEESETEEGDEE